MTVGAIIQARRSRPVSQIPFQEMKWLIADVVVDEAFSLRCEAAEQKLLEAIVNLVTQELCTTYSSWRADELRIAIRAGACSQLGPMYRLCPAEFVRIMDTYHTCPMRLEALRILRREAEKPQPENPAVTKRKFRESLEKIAKECFADVARDGRITYYSDTLVANIYDLLCETGTILTKSNLPENAKEAEKEKRHLLEEAFKLMASEGKRLEIP
ncbi:MAG: hypothetical protein J6W09_02330 [Bacteroidales bacterium]|nr:hypothetical protein [Bacteroidales bacterium]